MSNEAFFSYDGGVTMVGSRTGHGPKTFVLVHGIGMGRRVFQGLAELLGEAGQVVTLDLPGFGDSPEPEKARTIPETAELVAGFIRRLEAPEVVLIGHSMGTQVVAEVAVQYPELISQLVLIAPTVNTAERTAVRQAWRMVQDLWGESLRVLILGGWQYAKAGIPWFVRKLRIMLDHPVEETYPKIQVETLVLRGETDKVCPRVWVEEVAELIPGARYDEVPGHGHEAMIRDPEDAARIILAFASEKSG